MTPSVDGRDGMLTPVCHGTLDAFNATLMGNQARSDHPLLWIARQMTKPGEVEPKVIDREASELLQRAIRDYAAEPDLVDGIRALGAFAASLAQDGSPSAGKAVVRALEQMGPELEKRFDAGDVAAALDEVGLDSCAFAK